MQKILLLFFLCIELASCQTKGKKTDKVMRKDLFEWEEGTSAPAGYPMRVYAGGMTSADGKYVGFPGGIIGGYWGQRGSGMYSVKEIPKFLHVQWLSYTERCFYEVDAKLDYDLMLKLFQEGYLYRKGMWGIQPRAYDNITVGFAPGGVVMVWLNGSARTTEVGRYQGHKITIPQEVIDKLDSDKAYIFNDSKWQSVVEVNRTNLNTNDYINPEHKDLKKKLDNEPIPFGLWDTYRQKYTWNPVFEFQNGGKLNSESELKINYLNGNFEHLFSDNFPLRVMELRALPKRIVFDWKDSNDNGFGALSNLSEESVLSAFMKVFGENSKDITAEMIIRVNIPNTHFTVMLKGSNGKSAIIKTEGLVVID